ncbi:MAG TPA: hypothetical protein DDW19_01825 [Anaerolineaceae bacterium]|jgi:hypothetical protein|nr:hypothetical protein [Anaerolineaceae bacterium]
MSNIVLQMAIEAMFDGSTWTDITEDVLGAPVVQTGIFGNSDADRVAGVGTLKFELNNSMSNSAGLAGYYSPGHANCRAGFKAGLPVRMVYKMEGMADTPKWRGTIAPGGILVAPGLYGIRRVQVTCYDWMQQANIHRLQLMAYTTSKRGDEALDLILANMPVQPASTLFDNGVYTFTSVFDTVRAFTTAMSEFQKICASERGYLYLRHNRVSDEQLVWEAYGHRDSITALTAVSAALDECGYLLDEDGLEVLDEDGVEILIDDVVEMNLSGAFADMEVVHGANLATRVSYTVYPKETFAGTLCVTQSRIELGAGETKSGIKLTYRDQDAGGTKVSAAAITPLASGTDYIMTANQDGSGTDLTSDLVVSYTAGVEGIEFEITNNGASKGYVYLQARGTGVRIYDKITKTISNAASELAYGTIELVIDAPYQEDPLAADVFSLTVLAGVMEPASEIRKVTFLSSTNMLKSLFLGADLGNRVLIPEQMSGISEAYFIQGMEWTDIGANDGPGTLVKFTWFLKRAAVDVLKFVVWDDEGTWDDADYRWYW